MNPIELGKFIASLRIEKNLTQEELAEKLYIDKRKISRWECGTSTPEFDMLIKLSEILDVSLYELSICRRIETENITRKVINKFKSIKDFKTYKVKKKLQIILLIIFFIIFMITATYTIKYNNTVKIYEVKSADENYYLDGVYISTNDYSLFNIKQIGINNTNKEDQIKSFEKCEFDIYDNINRIFYITNDSEKQVNLYGQKTYNESRKNINLNSIVKLNVNCIGSNNKTKKYIFDIKLNKIYDNNIF